MVRDERRRNPTLLGLYRVMEADHGAATRARRDLEWCATSCTATRGARAYAAR